MANRTSAPDLACLSYDPLPSQARFHGDIRSRFKGFSGPVGSGKSLAMAYEALYCAALNPGCLGLLGAPTYPMLRDATQRALFSVLETEGIGFEYNKQAELLRFTDDQVFRGAEIIFRSLENFDRLRGTNLAWFGVDELTYCREEAWPVLEGRLRDPKAWQHVGFAAWTPKGFDWVYERFLKSGGSKQYQAVLASPMENRHLPPGFYESLREGYDEKMYAQEVLGQYLNITAGQVYYAFSEQDNVRPVDYIPGRQLFWSLDFNINPMCSVLAQRSRANELHILDEIVLHDSNTREACEAFHERAVGWTAQGGKLSVVVTGDPAGNARQHATGSTDYQVVKRFFQEYSDLYDAEFQVRRAHSAVRERVNATNSLLRNEVGLRRLWISPRCKELIKDYGQVCYQAHSGGVVDKSDPKRTHASDAAGYLIENEFPITKPRSAQQRSWLV